MKDILKTYKDRLINLSGRNRSLVLRKIHKKRTFDLSRSIEMNTASEELNSFLFERQKGKIVILDDPYKIRNAELKKVENQNEIDRKKELLALNETIKGLKDISEEEKQVLKKREEEINEKYNNELEIDKNKIEKKTEKIIAYSNNINYLLREIDAVEKETGKYELYISYPFVEGRFNDSTFVRAPLFMIPVKLEKVSNKWKLSNIIDQEILINKVFLFAYSKFNDSKITELDTEFSSLEQFDEDVITGLLNYLQKNRINIEDTNIRKVEKFEDYTNEKIPNYKAGELILKNYMILGQFPLSNSIYTDYQYLEQEDLYNEVLESLLINKEEIKEINEFENPSEQDKKQLEEKEVFFLSSLDNSQENAVLSANNKSHLVIYGPPGTGKSQTIANIICDSLAKGKKVLMVSQKRAALDVIYNRLADINSKIALIHDANKDKRNFYRKVCDCTSGDSIDYDNSLNLTIDDKSTIIDEKISNLGSIVEMLHGEREFGISLHEMYSNSKAITSTDDPRYENYREYRKDNLFNYYKYHELKEAVDNIAASCLITDTYVNYKNICNQYPMVRAFKVKLDFIEATDFGDNINLLIEKINNYKDTIDIYTYMKLGELYQNNDYKLTKQAVIDLAHKLNHEINGHLIEEEDTDNKWWNPNKWINHKSNKIARENNILAYEEKKKELENLLIQYGIMINEIIKGLNNYNAIISEDIYRELCKKLTSQYDITKELESMINATEQIELYHGLKNRVDSLSNLEVLMLDYAIDTAWADEDEDIINILNNIIEFSILIHINEIEKSKEFNDFYLHYSMYKDTVNDINNLMLEKNQLTADIIKSKWNDKLELFIDTPMYKEFKRQAEKKRKTWPIRKYVIEFSELLLTVFPCWLLSPETVSDILPLKEGMFDMVIFDEASQMYVENAIPAVYRGKQVVVTGDDKQLKPSSTFMSRYDDFDEEITTIETAAAFEEESLLDLAKINYSSVHLNYHYRSRYEELINFSNYAFYGGNLNISPNIVNLSSGDKPSPIERIKVDGKWIERKNNAEASKVVDLVANILKTRQKEETIGIITFNVTQKDLISDLLDARGNYDKEFKKLYQQEKNRKNGNEDVSIFVKNIENVQGDERDIIIFSIGYAPNELGKVSVNFGALSQDGGENRLNVAISRGKQKVYVVTSIEPEELKVEGTKNIGAKLFKNYLQYAREVSDKENKQAENILSSLIHREDKKNQLYNEGEFVEQVYGKLKENGYNVEKHVGVSEYKIDLAIYDKDSSRYILGIECDGKSYLNQPSTRERDIHRKRFLESRGWNLMRIWSLDWWKNLDKVLETINDRVNIIKSELNIQVDSQIEVVNNEQESNENDNKHEVEQLIHPEKSVWFGDKVYIRDNMSKEIFEIDIEANPYNKDMMNDFSKDLLTRRIDEIFVYQDYEYKVINIDKK
jgi:very-short-patch-repair endonuclease